MPDEGCNVLQGTWNLSIWTNNSYRNLNFLHDNTNRLDEIRVLGDNNRDLILRQKGIANKVRCDVHIRSFFLGCVNLDKAASACWWNHERTAYRFFQKLPIMNRNSGLEAKRVQVGLLASGLVRVSPAGNAGRVVVDLDNIVVGVEERLGKSSDVKPLVSGTF